MITRNFKIDKHQYSGGFRGGGHGAPPSYPCKKVPHPLGAIHTAKHCIWDPSATFWTIKGSNVAGGLRNSDLSSFLWPNFKRVHHSCQAIVFMFDLGSCSSYIFHSIDTEICLVFLHTFPHYWSYQVHHLPASLSCAADKDATRTIII